MSANHRNKDDRPIVLRPLQPGQVVQGRPPEDPNCEEVHRIPDIVDLTADDSEDEMEVEVVDLTGDDSEDSDDGIIEVWEEDEDGNIII